MGSTTSATRSCFITAAWPVLSDGHQQSPKEAPARPARANRPGGNPDDECDGLISTIGDTDGSARRAIMQSGSNPVTIVQCRSRVPGRDCLAKLAYMANSSWRPLRLGAGRGAGHCLRRDAVVVVDVLSFTTAVSVAATRGALIFPYPWEDGASVFAASKHANLAGTRAEGGLSLSPVSLLSVRRDDRVVLRSPNGATICFHLATTGVHVIAGCLRNASAVGRLLADRRWSVAVIAGGERWPGAAAGIRPCLEDLLGAGAVLSGLPQYKCSPEALAAVAAYQRWRATCQGPDGLRGRSRVDCVGLSGRRTHGCGVGR